MSSADCKLCILCHCILVTFKLFLWFCIPLVNCLIRCCELKAFSVCLSLKFVLVFRNWFMWQPWVHNRYDIHFENLCRFLVQGVHQFVLYQLEVLNDLGLHNRLCRGAGQTHAWHRGLLLKNKKNIWLCSMDDGTQLCCEWERLYFLSCAWWIRVGGSLGVAHPHWIDIDWEGKHAECLQSTQEFQTHKYLIEWLHKITWIFFRILQNRVCVVDNCDHDM